MTTSSHPSDAETEHVPAVMLRHPWRDRLYCRWLRLRLWLRRGGASARSHYQRQDEAALRAAKLAELHSPGKDEGSSGLLYVPISRGSVILPATLPVGAYTAAFRAEYTPGGDITRAYQAALARLGVIPEEEAWPKYGRPLRAAPRLEALKTDTADLWALDVKNFAAERSVQKAGQVRARPPGARRATVILDPGSGTFVGGAAARR